MASSTHWGFIRASPFSPNPPKDTDGRREESGRRVRELQGNSLGSIWGREVGGRSSSPHRGPYGRLRELRCAGWRENTQQGTLSDRAGASLRGSSVVRWVGRRRRRQAGSGMARSRGQGAAELLSPRPAIRKMQGQPACRAGKPSGQGEEPPPEGLGGGYPLSQTDPRRPAGQVVGHRLDGQPGAVGGEAARGEDGSARRRT